MVVVEKRNKETKQHTSNGHGGCQGAEARAKAKGNLDKESGAARVNKGLCEGVEGPGIARGHGQFQEPLRHAAAALALSRCLQLGEV